MRSASSQLFVTNRPIAAKFKSFEPFAIRSCYSTGVHGFLSLCTIAWGRSLPTGLFPDPDAEAS